MKFAHLADCHLGGWRQGELRQLNLESFKFAIDECIRQKVDFVLIAGDLFDSAYPPVEILEETFYQLKKLKDLGILCYLVAGSHDYSASGKTFLSVLEKAGFCKNLYDFEEKQGQIFLNPTLHKNIVLYGWPGKKAGLEVEELRKIKLQDSPLFKIFALHTSIKDAVKTLPIESINEQELPKADYYALGHLHINYNKERFVYSGPIFPNNFQELEELKGGSFYIVETEPFSKRKVDIKLREIEIIEKKIENSLTGTEEIISELGKREVKDKIILIKVFGELQHGKVSDIKFHEIEYFLKEKKALVVLRNISKLKSKESEIEIEIENMDKMEEELIEKYKESNNSKFKEKVFPLINSMSIEKEEGETTQNFEARLMNELNKVLNFEDDSEKNSA